MTHATLLKDLDEIIAFFEEDNALFAQKERTKVRERMDARQQTMEVYTFHLNRLKNDLPKEAAVRAVLVEKLRRLDAVLTQNQIYLAAMADAFTTLADVLKKDMFAQKDLPVKRYGQVGKALYSNQAPYVSVSQTL